MTAMNGSGGGGRFVEEMLPAYSTERYYLLAQIQAQESDLVFTDMSTAEAEVEGYAKTFRSRLRTEGGGGEDHEPGETDGRGAATATATSRATVTTTAVAATLDESDGNFGDTVSRVSVLAAYVLVVLREGFDIADEATALVGRVEALASHHAVRGASGPKSEAVRRKKAVGGGDEVAAVLKVDLTRMLEVDVLALPPVSFDQAQDFARTALRHLDATPMFAARPGATAEAPRSTRGAGADRSPAMPHFAGRAVSVFDKPEACPGIERIASRLAGCLPPGALRVVACDRDQLMGAVPDCEPDAVQGVSQWTVGDVHPYDSEAPGLRAAGLRSPAVAKSGASTKSVLGATLNFAMALVFIAALLLQLPGGGALLTRLAAMLPQGRVGFPERR